MMSDFASYTAVRGSADHVMTRDSSSWLSSWFFASETPPLETPVHRLSKGRARSRLTIFIESKGKGGHVQSSSLVDR
jgi:hypothetical protein